MKLWNLLLLCPIGSSLIFGTKKLFVMDKTHLKTYVDTWIDIWKTSPTPLSDLRMNECWKSVIWCAEHRHKPQSYCLCYKRQNYFIFVMENDIQHKLKVIGLLESPENVYSSKQIEHIHEQLELLANVSNYTVDYSLLKNWSHGYYLREYQ